MNPKTHFIFFVFTASLLFSGFRTNSRPLTPPPEISGEPPPMAVVAPASAAQKAGYNHSSLKPGIAVIVGVLTTIFSVTFLLLLYAKHCRGERNVSARETGFYYYRSSGAGRKNSGINPMVIESLPVFQFGSLIGGPKEGLDCAVCLNRFEPAEILRLLPKCKHAFHVECVDTWLDSHSTCPLCRFRVDPEDVLLVDRSNPVVPVGLSHEDPELAEASTRRVSGRHSSAGERGRGGGVAVQTTSSRRSCDGSIIGSIPAVHRKDGLLLTTDDSKPPSSDRRLSHRIILSSDPSGPLQHYRWSDVQPCDLFYLRSEMLMNEGRRSSISKGGQAQVHGSQHRARAQEISIEASGRNVINGRSVSEITGLSRLPAPGGRGSERNEERERHRQRHNGAISRWTAWISQSRPDVRS